jgi:hypothetical protein
MAKRLPPEPTAPSATREEATAIMAALARFERDAEAPPAEDPPADGWRRAAILEGLRQQDDALWQAGGQDPWINT